MRFSASLACACLVGAGLTVPSVAWGAHRHASAAHDARLAHHARAAHIARAVHIAVTAFPISPAVVATAGVGGATQVPALAPAPDGSDAEWLVVNGQHQDLVSVTPTGQEARLEQGAFASDNGPPDAYASVDADGYDWILDNDQGLPEDTLYAVGAQSATSPGVNPVATFNGYAQDMTLGSDGALYINDAAGGVIRCVITGQPSASCTGIALGAPFDGGAHSVGAGGPLTWFADGAGELGAVSPTGALSGPFGDVAPGVGALGTDPGTIVMAPDGLVYAAGGAETEPTGNGAIVAFNPADPSSPSVVASGLHDVVAMTVGPDGNIWFLDAGALGGAGAVGRLTVKGHGVTEYPLPAGVALPAVGARIAAGPAVPDSNGDGEVLFSATSTTPAPNGRAGIAEVGEVTGIPFPVVAGTLALKARVSVSRRRVVVLTLNCAGAGNAQCVGRLKLRAKAVIPASVASGQGSAASDHTRIKRFVLGSVSYRIRGGSTWRHRLRLSRTAFATLERAAGHRFRARLTGRAKLGSVNGRVLTIVGP